MKLTLFLKLFGEDVCKILFFPSVLNLNNLAKQIIVTKNIFTQEKIILNLFDF